MEKTISVVGIGPGKKDGMTFEAAAALAAAEVIVGYRTYTALLKEDFPEKTYLESGMRDETARCKEALRLAAAGKRVAVVSSGDSGVYGMASLLYELREASSASMARDSSVTSGVSAFSDASAAADISAVCIRVIPGVTAAVSGAALLGAPLSNDYASISLSDRLTPPALIERRLRAAAEADLCTVLYNPVSKGRRTQLLTACDIFLSNRKAETVCGIATKIGRDGETAAVLTLGELRAAAVRIAGEEEEASETADTVGASRAANTKPTDSVTAENKAAGIRLLPEISMRSTVFIGCSATRYIDGFMVTPRGYRDKYGEEFI